jgi:hypothetical protein
MAHFIADYEKLVAGGRRTGYTALVQPGSFDEQLDETRRIRDALDALDGDRDHKPVRRR